MAQINTYDREGGHKRRIAVQYERGLYVNVGVEHAQPDPDGPEGAAGFPPESGLWCDLDRAGINNLIRALREARDKAFGRDE